MHPAAWHPNPAQILQPGAQIDLASCSLVPESLHPGILQPGTQTLPCPQTQPKSCSLGLRLILHPAAWHLKQPHTLQLGAMPTPAPCSSKQGGSRLCCRAQRGPQAVCCSLPAPGSQEHPGDLPEPSFTPLAFILHPPTLLSTKPQLCQHQEHLMHAGPAPVSLLGQPQPQTLPGHAISPLLATGILLQAFLPAGDGREGAFAGFSSLAGRLWLHHGGCFMPALFKTMSSARGPARPHPGNSCLHSRLPKHHGSEALKINLSEQEKGPVPATCPHQTLPEPQDRR